MAVVEYEKLNRMQKLACFLVILGPQRAAQLLQAFEEDEMEQICREITQFDIISDDLQRRITEEFSDLLAGSVTSVLGGPRFAQKTLSMVKGDYHANHLLNRLAPMENTGEIKHALTEMPLRLVYNFLRDEQPQTVAYVLAFLSPDRTAQVIKMLAPSQREDVIERIGLMEEVSLEHIHKLIQAMRQNFTLKDEEPPQRSGGLRVVADVLNNLDKDMSKNLLAKLTEKNPTLGQAVQRKMFAFENLAVLSSRDLQRVMREIESKDLVISLKSATKRLQDALLGAVSKRAAETIMEEMEMLGPVRLRDVEMAQDRIIQAVRMLEEEGEITLDQGGDVVD
jgi:flagellar motor switch protein FliG